VVALVVNTLAKAEGARNAVGAAYPVLADPDHRVAEAYGVYDLLGDGLAAPSVFVIGSDGQLIWSYVGRRADDRPSAVDVLAQLP